MLEQCFLNAPYSCRVSADGNVRWKHSQVARVHRDPNVVRMPGGGCVWDESVVMGWLAKRSLAILARGFGVLVNATSVGVMDFVCEDAYDNYVFFVYATPRLCKPSVVMRTFVDSLKTQCVDVYKIDCMFRLLNVSGDGGIRCHSA
eukprot:3938120-Rhodomonas_salina.1